ncbi:flavin reductase family protein [Methanospirillum stamsii]|uniref:Flavin reductase family protein n=1 Tax=Methanospirillum stamsii TaxID=1277351 RepID=A0A2V2NE69_9EURY|nr:flavin reductase family protein [Methanospirillum stamsii]PWR75876.1 flavin reductase family protein [Methanospirillum stamsii]
MDLKPFKRESVMPLPVTFISTISNAGVRNIAPYSCVMPVLRPLDLVCIATAKRRDTLDNIRENGEFVINMAGTALSDKVIPTARMSPPEEDEFITAELDEKPSVVVKPPGIKGCYAWMECKLDKLFEEPSYILIMGKVVHLEIDDEYFREDGSWDVSKAEPLMMTGSDTHMHYGTVTPTGRSDPFSAMFPGRGDPLAEKYREKSSK